MEEVYMIFKKHAIAQRILLVCGFIVINAVDKQCKEPILVLSNRILTNEVLPQRFRTMQDKVQKEKGIAVSTVGLKRMKASGSSEMTPANLTNVIANIRTRSVKKITIVDLRLESHSWINGLPYYWLASPDHLFQFGVDCYNQGKTVTQIEKDEMARAAKLMESCQATVFDFSKGHYPFVPTAQAKSIAIENAVLTEKDLVMLAGVEYLRLPISDDSAPSWHIIDRLVNYFRSHPDNWLHVHCNEGHGRTTTVLAMIDMLYNAKNVDFNSIILRQKLIGVGGADLFNFDSSGSRAHDEFVYRLELLNNFYRYCKENKDNFVTPFSVWAAQLGLTEERISTHPQIEKQQEI